MVRCGTALTILSCLLLAGCGTSPAKLAGADGIRDGQTLSAKPGMGRLYLIQGYLTQGPLPVEATTDGAPDYIVYSRNPAPAGAYVPPAQPLTPMAAGSMVGALAAAIIGSTKDKPTAYERIEPLSARSFFYIGEKKIADIGKGDYVALDLPPGSYDIKLCLGLRDCPVAPTRIEEGKVVYYLSDADTPYGPYFEVCRKECGQMVLDGRRVIAWDPVKGAMQPK